MSDEQKPALKPMSELRSALAAKLAEKQAARKRAEEEARLNAQKEVDDYYRKLQHEGAKQAELAQLATARHGPRAETGGLAMPTQWWGAELEALAAGMPPEDVAALKERMERISTASDNQQIIDASQRLQALFRDKPGLTSLINPVIMRAYVLKMQQVRHMTFTNAVAKAGAKLQTAKATASLDALMADLD